MKKTTFTQPENRLKQLAGDGGLPESRLKKCQEYLDANDIDFSPFAKRDIDAIEACLGSIRIHNGDAQANLSKMLGLVTQLKATGTMLHYPLVSTLSSMVMALTSRVTSFDADVIDIFDVYVRIMRKAVNKRLKGPGGEAGAALIDEMREACARYDTKHGLK